jgi:hypothetical protein
MKKDADVDVQLFKRMNLERHIGNLRRLEAENQHPEWLVYYAENLAHDRRLTKAAEALLLLQNHFGELTKPLYEVRKELYAQAKFLFRERSPEAFEYARARGV